MPDNNTVNGNSTNTLQEKTPTLRERLLSLFSFRSGQNEEDISDTDLRRLLYNELRKVEPAFLDVDSVFASEGLVVYAVNPEDSISLYRRSYELAEDGGFLLEKIKMKCGPLRALN